MIDGRAKLGTRNLGWVVVVTKLYLPGPYPKVGCIVKCTDSLHCASQVVDTQDERTEFFYVGTDCSPGHTNTFLMPPHYSSTVTQVKSRLMLESKILEG